MSARRGALSRAADAVRDWLSERPTEPGVYVRPAALDAIIARERGLLEEARGRGDYAIRKAIAAETLKRYGVSDPESALTPRSDRETFDSLRALYGGRPAQGKAAASAPASLGGLRREYGDALSEFMGSHKMGVLRYADVLKGFEREARIAAERAQSSLFKARAGELAARREFGAGSRECLDAKARAERAAEHAVAAEMNRRDSAAELAEFEGLIRGYREGLTKLADATRADLDLDALVREARARRLGMANRANGANGENSRGDTETRRGGSGSRQGQSAVGTGEAVDGGSTNGKMEALRNAVGGLENRWPNPEAWMASLAVRRAKAAARKAEGGATSAGTSGGSAYLGPSVAERVRSDLAESFAEYEGRDVSVPTISDSASVERRQAAYADAFRKWWGGVETTAGNIEAFNAFVASAGGALAAGAGAYSGAYPTAGNQALGKYYTATGRTPAYDGTGRVGAGVRVGRPPYAARRASGRRVQMLGAGSGGTGTVARGMPTGPAPLAKFPAAVAGLLSLGLDPLNDPKTADDLAFRAAYEKHLDEIRGVGDAGLAAEGRDPLGYANGPAGEMSAGAPVTRTGLRMRGAKEAARALGILHGAYGAGGGAPELPEGLAEEYALGLAEGAAGYGYGVRVPADRVAVLRMARSFADTAAREEEGYAPDHLNDRFNLEKWESAAKWAARNLGVSGVPAPDAPDTRAQYSAESLMRTALDWFGGAMARGDRDGANAALAYMGDLLYSLSGDRRAVADAYSAEGAGDGDEDAPEVDARMPEFDGDGNEVGGESPFYEDSYADPHARMPWAQAEFGPIARRFRLPNRWSAAARAAARASRKANGWGGGGWSDAARAASLAVRRAKSAARKAAEAAQVAGPADQLPLAHPGFGAADDALEDYLKRKRRHEANEARKAADKARLQEERGERRRKRSSSLKEKSDEPGLREKFDRPGLREKFQEANEKTDRGRLKDKYAKSNPVVPAQGFSAPVKGAVFYYNGNFYDSEGNWVAKAKPSQKNGAVWQNGLWYDAASGKTLGRTVAAS